MRANETHSDLRAVELCGDAEALVSALIRLHAINHLPRRFSIRAEEQSTHPSLARRIRDIRKHAGNDAPQTLGTRCVLRSVDEGRFAILDRDHVSFGWSDGVLAPEEDVTRRATRMETIAYGQLGELRLVTTTAGGINLAAVDKHSRCWVMPLLPQDVPRTQAALDVVDQLLSRAPAKRTRYVAHRLSALTILMVSAVLNAALSVVLLVVLILSRPTRAMTIALSTALAGSAFATISDGRLGWTGALALALCSATAAWLARRLPRDPDADRHERARTWVARVGLGLPVVIGAVMIGLGGRHLFDFHATVRDQSWFAPSLLALSGYLAASPLRTTRRSSLITGAAGAVALWAGSPWFLETVVRDPLAGNAPLLEERSAALAFVGRSTVDGEFTSVRLSPDGDYFVLSGERGEYDDDGSRSKRYLIGARDGWSRELRAQGAAYAGSQHVIVLDRDVGTSQLRAEAVRGGPPIWTLSIPDVMADTLDVDSDGRWRLSQTVRNGFVRVEGRIGAGAFEQTRWSMDTDDHEYVSYRVDEGAVALGIVSDWEAPSLPWYMLTSRSNTSLIKIAAGYSASVATTRLTVDCLDPGMEANGYVCVSFDGRWSRVWRLDPETDRFSPQGRTRGFAWFTRHDTDAQLEGVVGGRRALVRLDSATIYTLARMDEDCLADDHAIAGDIAATICAAEGETVVTFHRLPSLLQ
jgi:hypothetical protein